MNGEIDCMAINIRSGGVGVNLTRARYCAYINTGLSLGDFEQSLKRTDRYGQDQHVFYYHFIAKRTIDEKIYESLRNKKDVSSVLEGVKKIAMLKKKNKHSCLKILLLYVFIIFFIYIFQTGEKMNTEDDVYEKENSSSVRYKKC